MNWQNIFNASLLYATWRSATPIIYAALCASITQQANILNIGTEGIMLMGAFTAVSTSYLTGSWILGVLAAMVAGMLMAFIMAIGNLEFSADITAIGMGINLFAIAFTKFLLNSVLGKSGTFSDPAIDPIPRVSLPFLEGNELMNRLFNNWALTEWFVIVLIIIITYVLYKTVWGLRVRSVGQHEVAVTSVGINAKLIQYQVLLISGVVGGLAGAHLSLGYSNLFTENMTNQRGFMGVAAMFFGRAHPVQTVIGCLVFGLADSIGARLQAYGWPSQIVLMMPYIVTIIVLAISMMNKKHQENKVKSALA